MMDEPLLSADSHVVEPAGMWRSCIAPAYRDRAPVARTDADGIVHWFAPCRFADAKLPSDFFRANIYISFQEDKLGVEVVPPMIGAETIVWGSDYPHAESTWPNSRALLEKVLANVTPEDRRRFVRDNTARLYGFD